MNLGNDIAKVVRGRFQNADVFEIARRSGITIVFGRWFPITAGEFCAEKMTITVNEKAFVPRERIVAHELGHHFVRVFEIGSIPDEEIFCEAFAHEILRNDADETGDDGR